MRNQLVLGAALAAMLAACGGKTDDGTGQTNGGTGGSNTGGSSAGGSSSAGKGGSGVAGFAGSSTAGKGGGTAGSGTAGSGTAGTGTAGSGTAGKGGGTGGTGTAGAGGGTSCCTSDKECGDFAYTPCVSGVCKPTVGVPAGQCWADGMCPGGSCQGAIVCPCGSQCKQPDKPGVCVYPTSDWVTCGKAGDCQLAPKGCCDACGVQQVKDVDAVDFQKTAEHFKDVCPVPQPCPACASQQNPDVAAFCIANKCNVVEISKNDVSACNVDTDCEMHLDQCCDCGSAPASQYVALNVAQIGAYEAQICGPGVGGCGADCIAMHPPGYAATCNQKTKHCEVTPINSATSCPPTAPGGGACNLPNGTMCEYGQELIANCREHVYCQNGQWSFPPGVACPPIDKAGTNGCLNSIEEAGAPCMTQGQNCDMGFDDTICTCGACFGGPCMMNATWACSGQPGPGCPTLAPDAGQPCKDQGLVCSYGVTCTFSMAMRMCDGGIWVDQPIACAN